MENPRYVPTEEEIKRLSLFLKKRDDDFLEKITLEYIESVTGKSWKDETVLEKIRAAVISQKDSYWSGGARKNNAYKGAYSVLGYMAYQMPGYVFEISELVSELICSGLLRKNVKILDVGSGPGTTALAVAKTFFCFDELTAEITAVEKYEPNREAYNKIVPQYLEKICPRVKSEKPLAVDITEKIPNGVYDLIICSNIINELTLDFEKKTEFIINLSRHLSPDGNLILIEPADLENSTELRSLSREAKKAGVTLYAPCNDIRGVYCCVNPCWSFKSYADIEPTKLMLALGGANEKFVFVNTDVKFSYTILRTDGHRKCGYKIPADAKRARLSQLKKHLEKRIHVCVSVMSDDIGDAKNYLYLVCDGTGALPVYAALPAFHRTPEHEALLTASYGSVVAIDSVLVRFNQKQNAYNLLLGKESFCRLIAGEASGAKVPDKAKNLKEKFGVKKKRVRK
ncbi:MAG: class I SAM-dependent methyltransferase [Methanocorpusculum sp.]|nr:class I SAM-dependent methyltransferase [Methanocorpusculum sp.]